MRKFWSFTFFFLFFAAFAAFAPFLVLYFQALDFSGTQIGLLAGIAPLVTLVTVPIWTNMADRTKQYRLAMSIAILASIVCLAVFPLLRGFYAVLAMVIITNLFLAPILALGNSAAMVMLGDEKEQYGRVRVGGTIGFGLAALLSGFLVERTGLNMAFWLAALLFFFAFLSSLKLVYGEPDAPAAEEPGRMRDLLREPAWVVFIILAFTGGVAFAVGNSYFFPYLAEAGIGETVMGFALTLGTIAEIPILLMAAWFLRRFNAYGTLVLALALFGLRMALFGLADTAPMVLGIQLINGLTVPLFMVAGVAYADELVPQSMRATGQGLFNAAMFGIGAAAGGVLGGLLITVIGGQALFLATGLATMFVVGLVVVVRGRSPAPAQSAP